MRSEKEMFDSILKVAQEDDCIRAVTLHGSRVDPHARKDRFQDYDVVYYVDDFQGFLKEKDVLAAFGETLITQTKDDQIFVPNEETDIDWHIFMMQFRDGNRLDLTIMDVKDLPRSLREGDRMYRVLLDKDDRLDAGFHDHTPKDTAFHGKKPSEALFKSAENEFYWLIPYIAKGVERKEYIYALQHLHMQRDCLLALLDWWVGSKHDFAVSTGKCHKHLVRQLPPDRHKRLLETYPRAERESIYEALEKAMALFFEVTGELVEELGFTRDENIRENMEHYLRSMREKGFYDETTAPEEKHA